MMLNAFDRDDNFDKISWYQSIFSSVAGRVSVVCTFVDDDGRLIELVLGLDFILFALVPDQLTQAVNNSNSCESNDCIDVTRGWLPVDNGINGLNS